MKRYMFGMSLALLLVAGVKAEIIVDESSGILTDVVETVMPVAPVQLPPFQLPVDPVEVKRMAVQAVENLNKFFVLPGDVRDAFVAIAQNSDLITQSIKLSWDQLLPMLKDLAMDLGPQVRETFNLLKPLANGNFDGVARVGDMLIIKAGDMFEVIFNYHPRLMQVLAELKDSAEAARLKLLLADFAAQRGFGGTINVDNINYALTQIVSALQNKEVLDAIANGIRELKTPGFWNRMEQKFAPEIGALRRLGQQALTEARALIIERTNKTPEQWVEEIKVRGQEGVRALEQATGKSVDEMKALAKAKLQDLGELARQNVQRIQGQMS